MDNKIKSLIIFQNSSSHGALKGHFFSFITLYVLCFSCFFVLKRFLCIERCVSLHGYIYILCFLFSSLTDCFLLLFQFVYFCSFLFYCYSLYDCLFSKGSEKAYAGKYMVEKYMVGKKMVGKWENIRGYGRVETIIKNIV